MRRFFRLVFHGATFTACIWLLFHFKQRNNSVMKHKYTEIKSLSSRKVPAFRYRSFIFTYHRVFYNFFFLFVNMSQLSLNFLFFYICFPLSCICTVSSHRLVSNTVWEKTSSCIVHVNISTCLQEQKDTIQRGKCEKSLPSFVLFYTLILLISSGSVWLQDEEHR